MGKKDEMHKNVPDFFKCPISLDLMKSPVILCTGVTYDRASIKQWLEGGNITCPATMQILDTKDLVPNYTLQRLIQIWSNKYSQFSDPLQFHSFSFTQMEELIKQLLELRKNVDTKKSNKFLFEIFVKIHCFAMESDENKRFLVTNENFIEELISIFCSEESSNMNPDLLEVVLKVIHMIVALRFCKSARQKMCTNNSFVSTLVKTLKASLPESRVAAIGIISSFAQNPDSNKKVLANQELVAELLELLKQRIVAEEGEIQELLSCLIFLTSSLPNKLKFIQVGGVKIVVDLMSSYHNSNNSSCNNNNITIELILTMLEMLTRCVEGRNTISTNTNCVSVTMNKLMKVSKMANEKGIVLLWRLCYFFRDQKAKEDVMRSNGALTKILLLMQSDCSSAIKRMCCDLLRIFNVDSKSCISNYDTKYTHIIPC